MEVLISIAITFIVTLAGSWIAHDVVELNTPAKTNIQYITQQTDVTTTQNSTQNVLQGQTTITVLDTGKVVTNMTINIAGVTNYTIKLTGHTNTNFVVTNQK